MQVGIIIHNGSSRLPFSIGILGVQEKEEEEENMHTLWMRIRHKHPRAKTGRSRQSNQRSICIRFPGREPPRYRPCAEKVGSQPGRFSDEDFVVNRKGPQKGTSCEQGLFLPKRRKEKKKKESSADYGSPSPPGTSGQPGRLGLWRGFLQESHVDKTAKRMSF